MHDADVISVMELEATGGEVLPTRETLALFNIVNITAVNLAIAINVGGPGSSALAIAQQHIAVGQI
jgi:hypothetical protein